MRREGRSPFAVGALTVAVIAIGCYLGFTKDIPFTKGYRVKAVFASAASEIRPKSPVRIAGVNIGKVAKVSRGPGGTALIEMEIDKDGRPLHADATFKIRPRLFLEGNFFVDVTPGSASAPELSDGATVGLPQTAIPVQFDQLLDVFDSDTRTSLQDLLRGFADALDHGGAAAARRSFAQYRGAFAGTAISMQALRGRHDSDLAAYIRAQARVSDTLARNRTQLASLITGFATTMRAFADHRTELADSLRGLDRVLIAGPAALTAIDGALPAVRRFGTAAEPGLRIAPPVLDASHPFLRTLGAALRPDALPRFARTLAPAAGQLARLNRRLPKLLDLVDKVSRCTSRDIIPTLDKQVPDGALSSDQPAWQDGIHSAVGLVGAQADFDGNGTFTRFYGLTAGPEIVTTKLTDNLVSISNSPLIGSRPAYQENYQPPIRPDAPCEDQALPNLTATTVAAPANQRVVHLHKTAPWSPREKRRRLRSAIRRFTR